MRRISLALMIAVLFGLALPVQAEQRYPIESRSDWHTGRYTQQHIIEAGDVPGHQIRIIELHRVQNEKSRMAVAGTKVTESWFWGYSDYVSGVGRSWGYGAWVLEDGNRIFSEYSGVSESRPLSVGGTEGTYHGTGRLTGGTGKFKSIRGTLIDTVEFNTGPSGYNRGSTKGEYWFID